MLSFAAYLGIGGFTLFFLFYLIFFISLLDLVSLNGRPGMVFSMTCSMHWFGNELKNRRCVYEYSWLGLLIWTAHLHFPYPHLA